MIQPKVLPLMLQLIQLFLDVLVDDVDNNAVCSVVDAIGHSTVGSVVDSSCDLAVSSAVDVIWGSTVT